MEPRKFEKITTIILILMMAGIIITCFKIYSKIFEFNEKVKAQKEIVYSPDMKYCKIVVDGNCVPMRADTNINISEVAGYDRIYNVSINYNTADIPQEKPIELKAEKSK